MIDVQGHSTRGGQDRIVSVKRQMSDRGDRLTIWIHRPGGADDSGMDIEVSMPEFLTALARAYGGDAAIDPGLDAPVEPTEEL